MEVAVMAVDTSAWRDTGTWSQVKECRHFLEPRKGKGMYHSLGPPERTSSANILI